MKESRDPSPRGRLLTSAELPARTDFRRYHKRLGWGQPISRNKLGPLISVTAGAFVLLATILSIAGLSLGASAVLAAVVSLMAFSFYSFRAAWICFSAAMTMSGISHQFLGLGLLPEQVLLVALLLHAFKRVMTRGRGRASHLHARTGLGIASLLIGSWLLIVSSYSAFSAPIPSQSLRLVVWVIINVVSIFIVCHLAESPADLVRDGLITTTLMTVLFVFGWLVANLTHSGNSFVEADYASSTYRLKGLMLEPNLLASLSLMWLCVSYAFRKQICARVYWAALVVLSFGIFITYTRAAWIILIFLIVASVWTMTSRNRGLVLAVLVAFVPLAILVVFGDDGTSTGSISGTIQGRFDSLLDFDSGTGAYRTRTWDLAWQDIKRDGLWYGHGYNSFSQTHFSNETSNGTLYLGLLWLSLIYDGGLLAFSAFVLALLLMWHASVKGSWWLYVALVTLSTSTNPTWFMFPWVLAAILVSKNSRINSFGSGG